MFKNAKKDYTAWLVFIGIVILLLEVLFFNEGLIFSLFIAGGMIYLGRRKPGKKFNKYLFFGGIVLLVINVFSMMTFRFLLLAILLHFFIQYLNSKKQPQKLVVDLRKADDAPKQETVIKTKPLFENMFLGQQKTPPGVYEWNDVNIQAGIGDSIIDLSYTLLPKGETVIFIRNLIGNVQILVPYEYEASVQHSCLVGSAMVFENHEPRMFNQSFQLRTAGYEQAEQKVKIVTSLIVGNLEVSRI